MVDYRYDYKRFPDPFLTLTIAACVLKMKLKARLRRLVSGMKARMGLIF